MQRFKSLIQSMPLKEQAFTAKKSNWSKHFDQPDSVSKILQGMFSKKDTIQISRGDLFTLAKQDDLEDFVIATILWGYPRGMRGNHFENIIPQIRQITDVLREASKGISDWSKHHQKVKNIKGLGLSTYSKFLYFLGVKVEGHPALILDKRIINVLNSKLFIELDLKEKIHYNNAVSKYPSYLTLMDSLSHSLDTDGGKLEMFLFEFGLSLKLDAAD